MNLDEAICHSEEVAEGYEEDISKWEYTLSEYRKRECVEQTTIPRCEKALDRCKQCASEHRQLAEWLKDYKRLLEQEPSVSENPNNCDLINREDALMALTGEWTEITDEIIHRFIRRIKTLPSVKPQEPKWIPVSERLPEEGGRYLVYTWSHEIEMAQYVDGYWNIKTPISAWMPLPEPYKDEYRQVDVMEIEDLERGIYTVKKVVLTDDNIS